MNDVISMERDIIQAVSEQLEDERVIANLELRRWLKQMIAESADRLDCLKLVAEEEGASLGVAVKEATGVVAGTLSQMFGKLRDHPLANMVRDDLIAMNLTETNYSMLYTLALAVGHSKCADIAFNGVESAPPIILALTEMLPGLVTSDLALEAPLVNPEAEATVLAAVHDAWNA
ncbi:hypothetical protein JIN85_06525 [Luteolibacter pohnpeiensis]|uniref:Uncharacterized protein n=1 Tax=Luteolibacter pohnpeiensis TaxID=454153 RepID=A0A934S4B4_9BACT|nr:hypothetical protein [Luteolibacter pohnpeiensis]MBK1882062.1 hypothetical protein [Luteolibacter pohnpeiensis]